MTKPNKNKTKLNKAKAKPKPFCLLRNWNMQGISNSYNIYFQCRNCDKC